MRWVVQTNLGKEYVDQLREACKVHDYEFIPEIAIPFSHKVPSIDAESPVIFYGATNWINKIWLHNESNILQGKAWRPGVFFNPESIFPMWNGKYGKHSLNNGAWLTTFYRASVDKRLNDDEDKLWFVRPASDMKEFAGMVISGREIREWEKSMTGDVAALGHTAIILNEPYAIRSEWRLFIVNGKVSTGSQYRTNHRFNQSPDVPQDVVDFAEARTKEYAPSHVFVMDIGYTGGRLYVIEIGCFNSAGFYAADVNKLVKDVSEAGNG